MGLLDEKNQPIAGRTIAQCVPMTGDETSADVKWKTGGDVTVRAGKPTKLVIEMSDAKLYAFQFGVGYAGEGRDH